MGAVAKGLRFRVLSRDGFRCVYCGATPRVRLLHADHVIPRASGGRDEMRNLVAACEECNLGKGMLTAEPPSSAARARELLQLYPALAPWPSLPRLLSALVGRFDDGALAAGMEWLIDNRTPPEVRGRDLVLWLVAEVLYSTFNDPSF
jgi:hypothetical protein